MTLEYLKKVIMNNIGEDSVSPTYWTSSTDIEITDFINDAIEEVCTLTGQYVEDLYLPIWGDKQHYIIDSGKNSQLLWINYARIEPEAWRLVQVDSEKLSREDYNWMTRTGTPTCFIQYGLDTIRLVPYSTSDGKLLEMNIAAIPPVLVEDDNVINIHENHIPAVIAYATAMLFMTLRNLDKAYVWFGKYLKAIGEYAGDNSTLLNKAIKPVEIGSATFRQSN